MAKISIECIRDINHIINIISSKMQNSFSCRLIDAVQRKIGKYYMCVLVFDKYYMRASNRASLTVIITENENSVIVDAVGAGGGQGIIFNFSFGAEEDFVSILKDLLNDNGLTKK